VQKSIYTAEHERFLELLKQVRKEAGLTQVQLAERLGTLQSRITDYERGVRRMDLMELRQVCEAVGIPLVEFVRRFEDAYHADAEKEPPPASQASEVAEGTPGG
jgi:transcriptional regulator with XRE-family HTH domain